MEQWTCDWISDSWSPSPRWLIVLLDLLHHHHFWNIGTLVFGIWNKLLHYNGKQTWNQSITWLQVHDIILLCAFIEPPCPPSPFTKKQLGITKETRYCTLHLLLSHGTKGILWQTRSLGEARNLPKPATTQCQASNSTKKLKLKMTVNNHFETTTLFTHKVDGQQQKIGADTSRV